MNTVIVMIRKINVVLSKNVFKAIITRNCSLISFKFLEQNSGKTIDVKAPIGKTLLEVSLGTVINYINIGVQYYLWCELFTLQ